MIIIKNSSLIKNLIRPRCAERAKPGRVLIMHIGFFDCSQSFQQNSHIIFLADRHPLATAAVPSGEEVADSMGWLIMSRGRPGFDSRL